MSVPGLYDRMNPMRKHTLIIYRTEVRKGQKKETSTTRDRVYLLSSEELLRQENAGLEGYGVRPALTVDLKAVTFRE